MALAPTGGPDGPLNQKGQGQQGIVPSQMRSGTNNQGFGVIKQDLPGDAAEGCETGLNRLKDRSLGDIQTGLIVPVTAETQDQTGDIDSDRSAGAGNGREKASRRL